MPKIFTNDTKFKIVEYGTNASTDFSLKTIANDLVEAVKSCIKI